MKSYPQPNEHGVYEFQEIVRWEVWRCEVEVSLVEIAENQWLSAISVQLPNSGFGEPLSDHGGKFFSREEALFAGLDRIEKHCAGEITGTYGDYVKQIIQWCKSFRQLKLF